MGYMHIENLYKYPYIFNFREVYVLEKIHGTSAHIRYQDGKLTFFSGGVSHDSFVALFHPAPQASWLGAGKCDVPASLLDRMKRVAEGGEWASFTVYGEAYGGKCQGMSDTYGKELRFVAFDVRVWSHGTSDDDNGAWLNTAEATFVVNMLGLQFVKWEKVQTTLENLGRLRDEPSYQAVRNGCGVDKPAEGIVIRPLEETVDGRGNRVICKYKREDFRETRTPREVDPEKLKVLEQADAIANEWVTPMRLTHVLDKLPGVGIEFTGQVIKAMIEDVKRESEGEVVWSKDVERKIGTATAVMFKKRINDSFQASSKHVP